MAAVWGTYVPTKIRKFALMRLFSERRKICVLRSEHCAGDGQGKGLTRIAGIISVVVLFRREQGADLQCCAETTISPSAYHFSVRLQKLDDIMRRGYSDVCVPQTSSTAHGPKKH